MTIKKYFELSEFYNKMVDDANVILQNVIAGNRGEMGLVNDVVKNSDKYKEAKRNYNKAFQLLRQFNSTIPKNIKQEIYQIRLNKKLNNK